MLISNINKKKKFIKQLNIKNLKLKYKKNLFNIKIGNIVYIQYLILKNDEVKFCNFLGICILKKNKNTTFILKNNIKKENISLLLYFFSPLLIKIKIIKKYKKKYRLSKLYKLKG